MMRHTLTFRQEHYEQLVTHLSSRATEQAAYLLCGLSRTLQETRLLVREVIFVEPEDILHQSAIGMSIQARSFLRAMKRAELLKACFVFVHSHPENRPSYSGQDDREEAGLFRTAYNRITTNNAVHASVVWTKHGGPVGRVWLDGGQVMPLEVIRMYGRRFTFHFVLHRFDSTEIKTPGRAGHQSRRFQIHLQWCRPSSRNLEFKFSLNLLLLCACTDDTALGSRNHGKSKVAADPLNF